MSKEFYAHSLPCRPEDEWQGQEEYLRNVAEGGVGYMLVVGG